MHCFDSKQLEMKVKVDILTVNELWSRILWNITSFIEKLDLFVLYTDKHKTNAYVFIYLNVFSTFGTCWKKFVNAAKFSTIKWKQRRLEGMYLGISEAKPLRFDCVNQFPHKDSVGHSSVWFIILINYLAHIFLRSTVLLKQWTTTILTKSGRVRWALCNISLRGQCLSFTKVGQSLQSMVPLEEYGHKWRIRQLWLPSLLQ